jgi:hypothetical protein
MQLGLKEKKVREGMWAAGSEGEIERGIGGWISDLNFLNHTNQPQTMQRI